MPDKITLTGPDDRPRLQAVVNTLLQFLNDGNHEYEAVYEKGDERTLTIRVYPKPPPETEVTPATPDEPPHTEMRGDQDA